MNVSTRHLRYSYLPALLLIWWGLMAAGCAHVEKQAPGAEEVKKLVETSTTLEKRGDVGSAVEDLIIALVIDPNNRKARDELNRLIAKRNSEAAQHYQAGIAVRNSNAQEAQKEFLNALRLRPDYEEAIAALRELHLATTEAVIQARLKKEATRTSTRVKHKIHDEEDELDMEAYSLDFAVSAFEGGNYIAAIRQFNKMKERYPNDPDIQAYLDRSWYSNGLELFHKKSYKKALESFSRVPKGFDHVGDYMAKCRQALKSDSGKKRKK